MKTILFASLIALSTSVNASGYFGHHNNFNDSRATAKNTLKNTVKSTTVIDEGDYRAAANIPDLPGYSFSAKCSGESAGAGGGSQYFGISFSRSELNRRCNDQMDVITCVETTTRLASIMSDERKARMVIACTDAAMRLEAIR